MVKFTKGEEYEQIIASIKSGLVENYEENIEYLMSLYKIYENHKDFEKISCYIRTLMYNLIPKDKRLELKKIVNRENFIEETLLEVEAKIQKDDFDKSLEIMEPLIDKVEKICLTFSDDDMHEFHNFDDFFEEQIYMDIIKPMKKLRQMPRNCALAYLKYGVILFELKRYDTAKISLEKASKLNPVNTSILFELSEICKINKTWDEYLTINKKCLEYAYSNRELARCYRNYGFYFIEQGNYEMAEVLYCFSLPFSFGAEKKIALSELEYMKKITGKTNFELAETLEHFDALVEKLKKYNIQLGANKSILNLALILAINATNDNQYSIAKYCYGILHDLTRSKEIYDLIGDKEINAIIETMN
jgi:tetratricopeptide (TPR) repeat protein